MERIVVGVDGSKAADRALRWAADEARAHGARLEVVRVYEHITPWFTHLREDVPDAAQIDAIREEITQAAEAAEAHAQQEVDEWIADLDLGDLEVVGTATEGSRPAEILVQRSSDAGLLVVGSRGRGGFAGLLLGSVSQQCATHATCPVVIIRAGDEG